VPEEIIRITHLPLVGYIPEAENPSDGRPLVARLPRSPAADGFRALRANLELSGFPGECKTLLVTSADPGDGKSFVVGNLAAILAQAGKQVIVLDADLRKPQIHHILGVPNEIGLQYVIRGNVSIQDAMVAGGDGIKGVITAGPQSELLVDVLTGSAIESLIYSIKKAADLVIVDSPPVFVADAITWASKVDGVLFVVRPGHTHAESARLAAERLQQAGAKVVGVVVNSIPIRNPGYGYSHTYRYYASDHYASYRKDDKRPKDPLVGSKNGGRTNGHH
jgi:capsular exopolysaccharide synthesis family protein